MPCCCCRCCSLPNPEIKRQKRLLFMVTLTVLYMAVELVVGYMWNSVSLTADAFHMLSDVIALLVAFTSIMLSPKKWAKSTFGWARAEVVGALINAVFLTGLCFSILVDAIKRFFEPEAMTKPMVVFYVGIGGLLINIIGLFVFHEGSTTTPKQDQNKDEPPNSFISRDRRLTRLVPVSLVQDVTSEQSTYTRRVEESKGTNLSETGSNQSLINHQLDKTTGSSDGKVSITMPSSSSTSGNTILGESSSTPEQRESSNTGHPPTTPQPKVTQVHKKKKWRKIGNFSTRVAPMPNPQQGNQSPPPEGHQEGVGPQMSPKAPAPKPKGSGNMNMRGVFLHVFADMLGSVVVVISSGLIWYFEPKQAKKDCARGIDHKEWTMYVDPGLSVIIVILIFCSTWPLLQETSMILLQTVPEHINIEEIKRRIPKEVEGALSVHHVHVWDLSAAHTIASLHVRCRDGADTHKITKEAKEILHEMGIHATTIQTESESQAMQEIDECLIACPPEEEPNVSTGDPHHHHHH